MPTNGILVNKPQIAYRMLIELLHGLAGSLISNIKDIATKIQCLDV